MKSQAGLPPGVRASLRRLLRWDGGLNCVLWLALLLGLWGAFPRRIGTVRLLASNQTNAVALPWFGHKLEGMFRFEAELLGPATSLSVRADDCVAQLDVDGVSHHVNGDCGGCQHCAYSDFALPELAPGPHTVTITTKNLGGEGWFDLKEAHGFTAGRVLLLAGWGFAAFLLACRCGFAPWVGWPVALAGLLALQYLEVTTPWVRQHDVEGHREYLDHLTAHGTLPAVLQGWETWQPPLYYYLATGWRGLFSGAGLGDPFRSVQLLGVGLYLSAVVAALLVVRRWAFSALEAVTALGVLVVLPGNLFFAARINNDTLLPVLGAGILLVTAEVVRTDERRWRWWLAGLLPLALATKGSSLAIAGGALLLVFWSEAQRQGWRTALARTYFTGLPGGFWLTYWWSRAYEHTGNPLYVNTVLIPDSLRETRPTWERLLSFDLSAYLGGHWYYDPELTRSFPTALVTSLLYGEYTLTDFDFQWMWLLRASCLGMLLILAVGCVICPRPELEALWRTCLVVGVCQAALTFAWAGKFAFGCNQNMRFWAQAFVPLAVLWGLGAGHFWQRAGWLGRLAGTGIAGTFLLGLGEFYRRLLF